jgi:hypothetical protein
MRTQGLGAEDASRRVAAQTRSGPGITYREPDALRPELGDARRSQQPPSEESPTPSLNPGLARADNHPVGSALP